jgi:hypothetical protein
MMEAARTSETLVNFYQTTRCYYPEDSHLHTYRRENLKSYNVITDLRPFKVRLKAQTFFIVRFYDHVHMLLINIS